MKKAKEKITTKICPSDILIIAEILNENHLGENEILSILSYVEGGLDFENRKRKYFLIKLGSQQTIGFAAYAKPDFDLQKKFKTNPRNSAELLNFFILKKFQGQGFGKKLFDFMCEDAKKDGKKFLYVQSGPWYKKSWIFYERNFDKFVGEIINKYDKKVNAKAWLKIL